MILHQDTNHGHLSFHGLLLRSWILLSALFTVAVGEVQGDAP